MNSKKIIEYLMMQTLEATRNGLEKLHSLHFDEEDRNDIKKIIMVQFQNIEYYAKMIIEKEGVL